MKSWQTVFSYYLGGELQASELSGKPQSRISSPESIVCRWADLYRVITLTNAACVLLDNISFALLSKLMLNTLPVGVSHSAWAENVNYTWEEI